MTMRVAPRAERGLKLPCQMQLYQHNASLPVRERGLKLRGGYIYGLSAHVAPRAGAWIETWFVSCNQEYLSSLPVRERGLKPGCLQAIHA